MLTEIRPECHSMFIITERVSLIILNPDPVIFAVTFEQGATYIPRCWNKITVACDCY